METIYTLSNFNQLVDDLPRGLKDLILGDKFNNPINNLPQKLEYLHLGKSFSHPINLIPNTIKRLYLSDDFSHQIIRLPKNIESIILSSQYKYLDEFKNVYANILEIEEEKDLIIKNSIIKFGKRKNNINLTNAHNFIIENFNNLIEYLEYDIFIQK